MSIWVLTIVGLGVTAFASLLVDQHNTLQLSFPAHALVALAFTIAAGTGSWLYWREPGATRHACGRKTIPNGCAKALLALVFLRV